MGKLKRQKCTECTQYAEIHKMSKVKNLLRYSIDKTYFYRSSILWITRTKIRICINIRGLVINKNSIVTAQHEQIPKNNISSSLSINNCSFNCLRIFDFNKTYTFL